MKTLWSREIQLSEVLCLLNGRVRIELQHSEPRAHVFNHTEYCFSTPSSNAFEKCLALSLPRAQIAIIYQLQGTFATLLHDVDQEPPLTFPLLALWGAS